MEASHSHNEETKECSLEGLGMLTHLTCPFLCTGSKEGPSSFTIYQYLFAHTEPYLTSPNSTSESVIGQTSCFPTPLPFYEQT